MEWTIVPTDSTPDSTPPKKDSQTKWFLIIIIGLIIIFGLFIALYVVTNSDTMGVTVIRMEGTMVTGDVSDAETVGSEVIGRELRDAANDPMVEAIVLRVNSPGHTGRCPGDHT